MGKGTDRFWWMMCLAWAALAAGPVGVQGQELAGPGMTEGPSSRAPIGTGTVLRVNDDAITSPEILKTLRGQLAEWAGKMDARQFAAQAKKALAQAVINEVQNRLLYQYANEVLEDSGNFEEVLKKEMADRRGELLGRFGGSEAEAHAQLQAVGSSVDRELESVERQMVISIYRDTYIRPAVEITRSQMMRYYSRHREALYHVEPTIQFQLIDVPAEAFAEGAAGAEAGLAEARRQAEAALQEIEDGKDFGQVVLRYSHGFYKDQEGLWRPMNPGSLSERYEPVVKALEVLEAGQHSGVVAGEDRFSSPSLSIGRWNGLFRLPRCRMKLPRDFLASAGRRTARCCWRGS